MKSFIIKIYFVCNFTRKKLANGFIYSKKIYGIMNEKVIIKKIFDTFLYDRLSNHKVDATATANILNFIGSSIKNVRNFVVRKIILLPKFFQYL